MRIKNSLILLLILISATNVYAWAGEINIMANESLNYGVNEIFNSSTVDNAYRLTPQEIYIMNPHLRSNNDVELCTSYTIYKYEWIGSSYVKNTDCYITIEECITMQYKVDYNGDGYYTIPDNFESQISDGYLVKRYFQSMLNAGNIACAEYDNIEEKEKPDVLEIEVDADVGNTNLDQTFTGYIIMDSNDEKNLKQSQDFGFDIDSVCGEGGSGELANTIGWGTIDDTSTEHKSIFEVFFFTLLPIIFVLLIFNMMGKVL